MTNPESSPPEFVYKICRASEWATLQTAGTWSGSADDLRDGFIHLSTAAQVAGTRSKHFAGETGLVLVKLAAAALAPGLVMETSRQGQLFPHLYGSLKLSQVTSYEEIEDGSAPAPR